MEVLSSWKCTLEQWARVASGEILSRCWKKVLQHEKNWLTTLPFHFLIHLASMANIYMANIYGVNNHESSTVRVFQTLLENEVSQISLYWSKRDKNKKVRMNWWASGFPFNISYLFVYHSLFSFTASEITKKESYSAIFSFNLGIASRQVFLAKLTLLL